MNQQHHHHTPDHVCHHGPLGLHDAQHDVICVDNVTFAYQSQAVLDHVTLHIEAGCNLGIIGPNGGGKTTLLKIILGLLTGYTGQVSVAGLSPAAVCRRGDLIGYVPQRHESEMRFPVNVRQVVEMGLIARSRPLLGYHREDREYVAHLMQQLNVAELSRRPIGQLSGGQQQRVFIARALACRPIILLLDEPTVGIDVAGQRDFTDLIHRLHDNFNLTIVVVSHDFRAVVAGCGKVAVLNRTIHYHDSPDGLTPDLLQEIFRHDVAGMLGV